MENRNCEKKFRCTQEQADLISSESEKNRISESEYMRRKIFKNEKIYLPVEITNLLEEIKYYDLKIGININQVVRSCNAKRFITANDYKNLVDYLVKIDEKHYEIISLLELYLKGKRAGE